MDIRDGINMAKLKNKLLIILALMFSLEQEKMHIVIDPFLYCPSDSKTSS